MERILDAALALIATAGMEGFTLTDLARRLGFTTAALYRYYASKDALIANLQIRALSSCRRNLKIAVERTRSCNLKPEVAGLLPVLATAAVHRQLAADSPAEFGLLALTLADPRQLVGDEEAVSVWHEALQLVAAVQGHVLAAETCGALAPGKATERAMLLVFAGQGVLQMQKLASRWPGGIDPPAMANALTDSLLHAWGAKPEALDAARRWE